MLLIEGTRSLAVTDVKERLAAQGFWPRTKTSSTFGPPLTEAVVYFQQTHLDEDGQPLQVDGIVGPKTMWALKHPTGRAQSSGFGPPFKAVQYEDIPAGIGEKRTELLRIALDQYGIRERPNGSNRGDKPNGGVDKFLPGYWLKKAKGPAWCCFFVSWVTCAAFGKYPLGRNHGSCAKAYAAAQDRGMAYSAYYPKEQPRPGDVFYMRWGPKTGHIGFVYRVSADGKEINTIEGNCGNRVKIGRRELDDRVHGFIDFWAEEECEPYERGLVHGAIVKKDSTR